MTARVVCAGIGVLDQVWELPALPSAPGKYIAAGLRVTGGGMAATAAVAVAALGGGSAWCGRLGADAAGDTLLAALGRHGVAVSGITVAPGGRTPTSGVLVDGEGERILAVFPGAGLPEDAPVPPDLVAEAGAVLADPRWVSGAERLFAIAAAQGLPRVLDADIAAPETLRRLARHADHVVFSQRGLVDLAGTDDPRRGLALAAAELRGTLAVTLGAAGSLWWREGGIVPLPAPRVAARDTTGCGDVFHGAYALALAEGAAVEQAARFATAAAALKAERGEGWAGMPGRAEVDALLARGW
ncbi:PfkB family carbohydrate kinase [Falsiroseomonas sp. CW058]|uniref:PfkB family carbohydrate kinase n=1 Tax=Falsiroseomonas sp. CW058 TaxID=3388664 RepID=UPI003D322EAB